MIAMGLIKWHERADEWIREGDRGEVSWGYFVEVWTLWGVDGCGSKPVDSEAAGLDALAEL